MHPFRVFGRLAWLPVALWLAWGARADVPVLQIVHGELRRAVTAAELASLPALEVEATEHGETHRYRGVAARDLLALVDAPLGERLRGPALALAVRARAADGYVAVFALAEFDPAFRDRAILFATGRDGGPLPPDAGPGRLICPGDQRGARGVRQLVSLEVFSVATQP